MSRARICEHAEGQRDLAARQRPHHERGELGDVVGEVVREEAADVGERRPALLDRGDDRGEVVVEQDQVGGLARHVGARSAHGDADVGLLERRAVVDPVAGHRHDVARRLQGAGDAQLVLRATPGPRRCRRGRAGRAERVRRRRAGRRPTRTGPSGRRSPPRAAIAAAVCGWSPVTMATLMPGVRGTAAIAAATSGAGGPRGRPARAAPGRSSATSALAGSGLTVGEPAGGHREHPQPPGREVVERPLGRRASSAAARHRGSTASGAPLTRTRPPSPADIRRRRGSNGKRRSSAARGRAPAASAPSRRANASMAASIGSPWATQPSVALDGPPRRARARRPRPRRSRDGSGSRGPRPRARRARSPRRSTRATPPGVHTSTTAISLRVRVPGLVRADEGRRAQRLDRLRAGGRGRGGAAIRCAPMASDSVTVGSSPSGTSATVTPMANRNPSRGSTPSSKARPKNASADRHRDHRDDPDDPRAARRPGGRPGAAPTGSARRCRPAGCRAPIAVTIGRAVALDDERPGRERDRRRRPRPGRSRR